MRYFFSVILLAFVFVAPAQVPSNYYDGVDNLTGDALWNGLSTLIANPNTVSYSQVDNKFVELGTDEDPNNSSNIIFFYMRDSRPSNSFTGNGNGNDNTGGWNKEHVWPRSRGVGSSGDDQQDMHMLRPTDVDVNSRRAALDFGLVSGNNTAGGGYFEPHDEVKGDCARILFYMVTAYKGSLELVETVTNSGNQLGNLSLMMQWHIDDPVDDFERNRNDIVYGYQGNANPYVNHPEWINEIWGDGTPSPTITTNANGTLNFGNITAGSSSTSQSYNVSGSNLEGNVSASVSAPFELSLNNSSWSQSVTVTQFNAEAGSSNTVYVRFSPTTANGQVSSTTITHTSTNASTVNVSVTGTESTVSLNTIAQIKSGTNGQEFTVEGVVTTLDYGSSNGQFFIQDESAGINVFYGGNQGLVSRGDRVRITGDRAEFSSIIELEPSTLDVLSSNQTLPDPIEIDESDLVLGSVLDGSLVKIEGVTLNTPSEWPTSATSSGSSVNVTVGSTSFFLRIDDASFYDPSSTPNGDLVVTGVLTRFNSDLQIMPFVDGDVVEAANAPSVTLNPSSLTFSSTEVGQPSASQSVLVNASNLTANLAVSVGDQFEISESESGSYSGSLSLPPSNGSISNKSVFVKFVPGSTGTKTSTISFTSTGISTSVSLRGEGVEVLGISHRMEIKIYPNPVDDVLKVEGLDASKEVKLFSSTGQRMLVKLISEGIDVSDLEHGLYYLTIKSATGTQVQKVLIK